MTFSSKHAVALRHPQYVSPSYEEIWNHALKFSHGVALLSSSSEDGQRPGGINRPYQKAQDAAMEDRFPLIVSQHPWKNVAFSCVSAQDLKLKGKVAVVTASTDGIGLAIAEHLAICGARVVISSRKQHNVDKAVASLKSRGLDVMGIKCHVGEKEDRDNLIKYAVEKAGGIDILISNAAVNPAVAHCPVLDSPEDAWDKTFHINVKCSYLLSQQALPHMKKRGGGTIIYISSIMAFHPTATSLLGLYAVTKTTLLGLTKAASLQCATSNIRVNCVVPGIIRTAFSKPLWDSPVALELAYQNIPLRRIPEPKEVAGLVGFLCSDDASYITGENIVIAGGVRSRL